MPDYEYTKENNKLKEIESDSGEYWYSLKETERALEEAKKYQKAKEKESLTANEQLAVAQNRYDKAVEFGVL